MRKSSVTEMLVPALDQSHVSKLVFLVLADKILGNGGQARMSLNEVARVAGTTKTSAWRSLGALRSAGIVNRIRRGGANNGSIFELGENVNLN